MPHRADIARDLHAPRLTGESFALYHHGSGEIKLSGSRDPHQITLPPLGWELVTVAPVVHGVAVIGLANKLNSSAAIQSQRWLAPDLLEIVLHETGPLAFYFERKPCRVSAAGAEVVLTRTGGGAWIADLDLSATTVTLTFR
jgi:hypothetical protein